MKMGLEISRFLVEGNGNPKFAAGKKLKNAMAVPDISGFFAEGEFKLEFARGKWKEVAAGREGTHVGSVKLGPVVERNRLPNLFIPKWKIAGEREEATIWGKRETRPVLTGVGKYLCNIFFFQCYPPCGPRRQLLESSF
jgi:hypothetical protein